MLLLFLKIYLALRLIRPCLFLISNMLDMLSDFLSIQTLFFANFFLRWAKKFQHEIIELALNRNTMPLLLVPQFALSTIHLLCINLLFYRPQSVWKEMFYKLEMPLNDTNSFIFNYQERLCSEYPFITLGWWSIAHLDLTRKLLSKTLAGCKIFIEDISGDTANALLPILQKSKSSSDIGSEYPDLTKKKQVDFAHDDKSVLPNTSDNQSSIDDLSLRVPSKAHALNTEEKKSSSRKDVNNDLLTSEGKSDIEGDDDAMNPTTLSAEMQAVTDEYLQKKTSTILQGRQPTLLFGYFGSLVALQNKRQPQ